MRRIVTLAAAAALAAGACSTSPESPIPVGAVYPTGGSHGMGGVDEYRGALLAAELINGDGGVGGRPVRLVPRAADSAEAAPGAVKQVVEAGASVVLGSYGSTISLPAAEAASRLDAVFWETGAVGELDAEVAAGKRFFRVVPTGERLGEEAVAFTEEQLLPRLDAAGARYGVAYVDDVYGRTIGRGAMAEIARRGVRLAGEFPYRLDEVDYDRLARRIERSGTDVLVVAAYLGDGIALRRAMVRAGTPLLASIGTSSSYCMPAFGAALGQDAVGLYASDKPDGEMLDPSALDDEAAAALRWARDEHRRRWGGEMTAPTLSGFASAWALFRHVLPAAETLTPEGIASAARSVRLPEGSLPNGSGLHLAPPGHPQAGSNLRATSVIWEWVRPETRAIVWPPALATSPIVPLPIS